jgi:hypothetical protein
MTPMRTKLLILTAALMLLCSGSVFAQANYNINIGGLPITSGSAVPGSCPVDGALFFKNVATESWNVCISGTYSALGAGGGGLPAHLTYSDPTLTVSAATFGNGQIALSGNTSGTATFTAPAVAGTATNGVTMSNDLLGPDGALTTPTYSFTTCVSCGMYQSGGTTLNFSGGGTRAAFSGSFFALLSNAVPLQFGASQDVAISRDAAGVLDVGSGASGNTTGRVKASGYMSVGTKFTTNNGCTDGANVVRVQSTTGSLTLAGTGTDVLSYSCSQRQ